ncbi:MAG: hypothetical protein C5B58_11810 [Acidobacteria bacterium]|nr:MAG: hypothetical protein C5B58_11810 [Acidobacteriota bacterium]
MRPLSGPELQPARKAAAERFEAVAMLYVPVGYTIKYRKSLSGRHWGQRKLIEAPRPVTRKSLYIFLHECAHAALGHGREYRNKNSTPRHVEEMQAEQWAHARMREHGISVPPRYDCASQELRCPQNPTSRTARS